MSEETSKTLDLLWAIMLAVLMVIAIHGVGVRFAEDYGWIESVGTLLLLRFVRNGGLKI